MAGPPLLGRTVVLSGLSLGRSLFPSPLPLILRKGELALPLSAYEPASKPNFVYLPAHIVIDREIERLGGPLRSDNSLRSPTAYLPKSVDRTIARLGGARAFSRALRLRSAAWQGASLSIMRAVTRCLTLSAYRGKRMRQVFGQLDLANAVQQDIRPAVGRILFGSDVPYPVKNPGPLPDDSRYWHAQPEVFMRVLEEDFAIRSTGMSRTRRRP